MHAIARAKPPLRAVALFPAAENMVSSNAHRPDDIVTAYDGTTVEVTVTARRGCSSISRRACAEGDVEGEARVRQER